MFVSEIQPFFLNQTHFASFNHVFCWIWKIDRYQFFDID